MTCGMIFHSKNSCLNHLCSKCTDFLINIALIFLIKLISIKMISLNSIEHPFFQLFCSFLCPRFKVPKPRVLREIIINYSKHLLNQNLSCIKSPYVSIMFDGTSRWSHHFISISFIHKISIYLLQN